MENLFVESNPVDRSDAKNTSCCCEGACGCAISGHDSQDLPIVDSSSDPTTATSYDDDHETLETESDRMLAIASTSAKRTNEYQETEDSSISKNAIVRLLASKLAKSPPRGASSSSTAASSPSSGTLREASSGKFSASSRDSCVTRITTVSACKSYEKLQDEFEIVSEAASVSCTSCPSTMASTPSGTPRNIIGRRGNKRRYSGCDLDSLYEGIRVLDSYLVRRNLNVAHGHRQSP